MEYQEDFKDMARILQQDPPVIVGGGGSAYIWIKRTLATEVADLSTIPNTAPHPGTPDDYIVYKITPNLTLAAVSKGDGSVTQLHSGMNPRFHSSVFQ